MLIGGSDEIVDQTRCEEVAADLLEQDGTLIMTGPFRRKLILGLCTPFAGPYPIARDDRIRELSNADLGVFLSEIFSGAAHQRTVGER